MYRYVTSSNNVDLIESKINDWLDQGYTDVDIDDAIFDLNGDESTIEELRKLGRIDDNGHYVYKV